MSIPNSAGTNSEAPAGAALTLYDDRQQVVLHTAIELWASASTSVETRRREEQLKNKQKIIRSFFDWVRKIPGDVEPTDVRAWCERIEDEGKSLATVYARVSRVSAFYRWLMSDPRLSAFIKSNPAARARPRYPRPYQSESTKALSDEEMNALLGAVRRIADSGSVVGKRD